CAPAFRHSRSEVGSERRVGSVGVSDPGRMRSSQRTLEEASVMRALMPWKGMDVLRNEMDGVFERFVEPRWLEFEPAGEWAPTGDVSENKGAVRGKAESPARGEKDRGGHGH